MDQAEISNWKVIADKMKASGDTQSWFYLRARAIADGKPDPMPTVSELMPKSAWLETMWCWVSWLWIKKDGMFQPVQEVWCRKYALPHSSTQAATPDVVSLARQNYRYVDALFFTSLLPLQVMAIRKYNVASWIVLLMAISWRELMLRSIF